VHIKATLFAGFFLGLITGWALPTHIAHAQTFINEDGPVLAEELGAARLRNFSATPQGAFLGIPDLGVATNRVEADIQWAASNTITWRLEPALDRLSLVVDNVNGMWTLHYDDWSDELTELTSGDYYQEDLNTMILEIWNRDDDPDALITLSDIHLDGQPMGSFSAVQGLTPPRERRWIVDHCFGTAAGFELSATLELADVTATQAELNRVNLSVGVDPDAGLNCARPADVHISIEPSEVTLFRGEEVVVGVTLSNHGQGPARGTAVELLEPEQLTMTDALAACGSSEIPGMSICPIGDISPDGMFYFELTIRADEDAAFGQHSFGLGYSTSSQNLNPVQGDSVTITVIPQSDSLFSDRFEQVPAQ
jgi:hypothetical protein